MHKARQAGCHTRNKHEAADHLDERHKARCPRRQPKLAKKAFCTGKIADFHPAVVKKDQARCQAYEELPPCLMVAEVCNGVNHTNTT